MAGAGHAITVEDWGVWAVEGDRLPYPIVEDSAQEVAAAYRLFRRDLSPDGLLPEPPLPHHMELLVDRQGYVRARWVADGAAGWADPARLLAAVARLAKEPPAGPPPDEHIH
jgi:putative copper resistance protein D